MNEDEKDAVTFNEDQQNMFGAAEANQAGEPVRAREPLGNPVPDVHFEPVEKRVPTDPADEPQRMVVAARGESGPDITGGTDKFASGVGSGEGAMAAHDHGQTEE